MIEPTPATPRVLIVDDTPQNLQLLEAMLRDQGYQVFAQSCGKMALKAAAQNHPDIILLDILMPELDGYAVCARLKADPQLQDIPVLFLSALTEPADKVRAFQAGGVDYIPKPFQLEEVEARVRTHLELSRQRRELRASYERLRELERLREDMVHMLVHDLRSPLTGIRMTLDLLGSALSGGDPGLTRAVGLAQRSAASLSEMVTQLLDVHRFEAGKMPLKRTQADLGNLTRAVLESVTPLAGDRQMRLIAPEPIQVFCDCDLIRRVLVNLLSNAFTFIPQGGEVRVHLLREDGHAQVAISDNGPGIPLEVQPVIFEKFRQGATSQKQFGTGLGLAFCKLAVEAHGCQIALISEPGQGSTFRFTLPLYAAAD